MVLRCWLRDLSQVLRVPYLLFNSSKAKCVLNCLAPPTPSERRQTGFKRLELRFLEIQDFPFVHTRSAKFQESHLKSLETHLRPRSNPPQAGVKLDFFIYQFWHAHTLNIVSFWLQQHFYLGWVIGWSDGSASQRRRDVRYTFSLPQSVPSLLEQWSLEKSHSLVISTTS